MLNVELNTFYNGIQQDDIIGSSWGIIDAKNLDGLKNGYGITLGNKMVEKFTTTFPIKKITLATGIKYYCGNDGVNGYIYKETDGFTTPWFTLTNTTEDSTPTTTNYVLIENMIEFSGKIYIVAKKPGTIDYQLHKINTNKTLSFNIFGGNIADGKYSYGIPSLFITGSFIYTILGSEIMRTDSGDTSTRYIAPLSQTIGMTQHGTQFTIYQNNDDIGGIVSFWDGVTDGFSANIRLGFRPVKVIQDSNTDYIYSEDGDTYIGSGYTFQRVTKPNKSRRLEDNSQYNDKLLFKVDGYEVTDALTMNKGDIYGISTDTTPGIYKYGKLLPGMQQGIHKIVSQINNIDIDYFYNVNYIADDKKLYSSYKQGSIYGVGYIDLDNQNTTKDGYFVTQIFRGPPNKINQIKELRVTTSYTSGNNYIKLYKRINNGSWELIRSINDSTTTIIRHKITADDNGNSIQNEFIDIQFKVEIHNDLEGDLPPIFHQLELIYDVIHE